jgi:hypothetical protein
MIRPKFTICVGILLAGVVAIIIGARTAAQSSAAPNNWEVPRTPWGAPDLQGVWTGSDPEASKIHSVDPARGITAAETARTGPPSHWSERQKRVILNPPPLTALGRQRAATPRLGGGSTMEGNFAGPEELGTWVRCLTRGLPFVMVSGNTAGSAVDNATTAPTYNNNIQIVQGQNHVVLMAEMIHDARVVPIGNQPHVPPVIRQWLGDSRGDWDGDTLVVDVTNFTDQVSFRGSTEQLHLVERFTRTGPDRLQYEVTLHDAAAWTDSWKFTVDLTLDRGQDYVLEYACQEGNYGLQNILRASRAMDAQRMKDPARER